MKRIILSAIDAVWQSSIGSPAGTEIRSPGGHEGRPYSLDIEVKVYACSTLGEPAVLVPSLVVPVVGWL